ncbi:MAG: hypothetical protein LBH91_05815 [Prevotellaceae bacterium]|jgi:hypothetical protein|nr:hypothetical protein [Prevotellaceae bacterium]
MKTTFLKFTALLLIVAGNFSSCETSDTDIHPLVGVWDCVKFAYVANGSDILDEVAISKGILTIPVASTPIEHDGKDRWKLSHTNSIWFACSLSDNLIELELKGSTFMNAPPEEEEIVSALMNAYSFIIRGNELIISFTGAENKNLLIFKKQ